MSNLFFLTIFNGALSPQVDTFSTPITLDGLFADAKVLCQSGIYGSVNFLASPKNYMCSSVDVLKLGIVFAIEGQCFVGVLLFRIVLDECEIEHVAVVESQKRLGIGLGLMQQLEHLTASQGVKKIFLEVGVGNLGARALYAKLGFLPIGKRTLYYRNSEDAIVMEKKV